MSFSQKEDDRQRITYYKELGIKSRRPHKGESAEHYNASMLSRKNKVKHNALNLKKQ
jgi:hypothetical protein